MKEWIYGECVRQLGVDQRNKEFSAPRVKWDDESDIDIIKCNLDPAQRT